jgi:hypothetical protein
MSLIDYYGDFAASKVACDACAWTGIGAEARVPVADLDRLIPEKPSNRS